MKKQEIIMILLIFIIILLNITITQILNNTSANYKHTENIFNISRNTNEILTQGDIAVYEFQEETANILEDLEIKVINPKNTVISHATINENKIIVDTSPLSAGTYRIKVIYDSQEMIVNESFTVVIIDVR